MNILFLTLIRFETLDNRNIYVDLAREISKKGHNLYIVSPIQKREKGNTKLIKENNVKMLRVKTGNLTKNKSLIEKGISTLLIEHQYLKAIKKYFPDVEFDMVMYTTPPITFNKIIKYFKQKHNSLAYLMLKDIFPQNAVDLGMMREKGLLHQFFRRKEIELYKNSDVIGAMSQGNIDYVLEHNQYLDKNKLEIFPNSILPIERKEKKSKDQLILKQYNIPTDKTLFVYGGNLGKPQGIDFLLEVITNFYKVENGHLLIIGNGTEFQKIKNHIHQIKPENISLFSRLPKKEYDELIASTDVGLIFLDHRFTIPNFPSRLTAYMENSLPILAATDQNTDLKEVLIESGSGYWSESRKPDIFIEQAIKLSENKELREEMGLAGRKYLEENYDVRINIEEILKHLK